MGASLKTVVGREYVMLLTGIVCLVIGCDPSLYVKTSGSAILLARLERIVWNWASERGVP